MKNKIFIGFLSLFLAIGVYRLAENNLDIEYVPDVMAATATSAIAAACTDPSIAAFQGQGTATITWSAAAAGIAATPSATTSIANAVNGDVVPTIVATLNVSGTPAGSTTLTYPIFRGKLAGLQCQANVDDMKVEVHGDGTDNTNLDIALSNIADGDNTYTAGDKVDDAVATAKDVLYGAGAQISTTLMFDGIRDADAFVNGEVGYGGNATESNGGVELHMMIKTFNFDVQAGTELETLTFTTTSS